MNFTTALRIFNCRGSLASLLTLHCSLVPEKTRSSQSQNFISKSIRPRLSKNKRYCCCCCYHCCFCCCCCFCCDIWDNVVSLLIHLKCKNPKTFFRFLLLLSGDIHLHPGLTYYQCSLSAINQLGKCYPATNVERCDKISDLENQT